VNACLVMAWQIDGGAIVTAEGIDSIPEARIVKAALAAENAFQCGYCAPGFVVTLTAMLRERAVANEQDIRYHSIVRGALHAVDLLTARDPA
jgi:carbon-monoxide dehydrogenase small subunit